MIRSTTNRSFLAESFALVAASAFAGPFRFQVTLPPAPGAADINDGIRTGANDVHITFTENINANGFAVSNFPTGTGFLTGTNTVDFYWKDPAERGREMSFSINTVSAATLTVVSSTWTFHNQPNDPNYKYVPANSSNILNIPPASIKVSPVPEPAPLIALARGASALLRRRRT